MGVVAVIVFAGANSPASLASRPRRVVMFDEVDKYKGNIGADGDPSDRVNGDGLQVEEIEHQRIRPYPVAGHAVPASSDRDREIDIACPVRLASTALRSVAWSAGLGAIATPRRR